MLFYFCACFVFRSRFKVSTGEWSSFKELKFILNKKISPNQVQTTLKKIVLFYLIKNFGCNITIGDQASLLQNQLFI